MTDGKPKTSFGFATVGHFFAAAFNDLHKVCLFLEREIPRVMAAGPVVEGISALIPGFGSSAVAVERAAFSALGDLLAAVNAADAAAEKNGLSVELDGATVAAFRQLIAVCRNDLNALGYKL